MNITRGINYKIITRPFVMKSDRKKLKRSNLVIVIKKPNNQLRKLV